MFYVVERYLPGLSVPISCPGSPGLSRCSRSCAARGESCATSARRSCSRTRRASASSRVPRRPRSPRPTAEHTSGSTGSSRPCSLNPITGAMKCPSQHPSRRPTGPAGRVCWRGSRRSSPWWRVAGWAIATYVVNPGPRQLPPSQATPASALRPLTPQERQYVLGILSLSPAQLRAAFGTELTRSRTGGASNTSVRTVTTSPPGLPIPPACGPEACWHAGPGSSGSSGLASLTSKERGYAQAIAGMSRSKQAAAFGTGK